MITLALKGVVASNEEEADFLNNIRTQVPMSIKAIKDNLNTNNKALTSLENQESSPSLKKKRILNSIQAVEIYLDEIAETVNTMNKEELEEAMDNMKEARACLITTNTSFLEAKFVGFALKITEDELTKLYEKLDNTQKDQNKPSELKGKGKKPNF